MNTNGRKFLSIMMLMSMWYGVDAKYPCTERDGSLDCRFGNGGIVLTDMSDSGIEGVNGVAVLPCGTIVAAGYATHDNSDDFALAAYKPSGELDRCFGDNGKVFTDLGTVLTSAEVPNINHPSQDFIFAASFQRDCNKCVEACLDVCGLRDNRNDNIVVVGRTNATVTSQEAVAVVRYKADGSLDSSFGTNNSGVTVIPVGNYAQANAVAIQADNKIVVVGATEQDNGSAFVMRLNCDGTLDQTFGCDNSGIEVFSFGGILNAAFAVKIQKDGKIVVAGSSFLNGSTDFGLARFTGCGKLDTCFGPNHTGVVVTAFPQDGPSSNDVAYALLLIDGCISSADCADSLKIVAVGSSAAGSERSFALAGYTAHGCLDHTFGIGGLVTTSFFEDVPAEAFAAVLEKDCARNCKIVAGGYTLVDSLRATALARYSLNGELDTCFGMDGKVVTTATTGSTSQINALTQQPNGDLVAGGLATHVVVPNDQLFALARYNVCTPCCVTACVKDYSALCQR